MRPALKGKQPSNSLAERDRHGQNQPVADNGSQYTSRRGGPEVHLSVAEGGLTTGLFVLVMLNAPREKFWGVLVALSAAGVTVRGVDLNSYEEVARQVKAGDAAGAATVFFPMHRVERVEMDETVGELPSLSDRFCALSGHDAAAVFAAGA